MQALCTCINYEQVIVNRIKMKVGASAAGDWASFFYWTGLILSHYNPLKLTVILFWLTVIWGNKSAPGQEVWTSTLTWDAVISRLHQAVERTLSFHFSPWKVWSPGARLPELQLWCFVSSGSKLGSPRSQTSYLTLVWHDAQLDSCMPFVPTAPLVLCTRLTEGSSDRGLKHVCHRGHALSGGHRVQQHPRPLTVSKLLWSHRNSQPRLSPSGTQRGLNMLFTHLPWKEMSRRTRIMWVFSQAELFAERWHTATYFEIEGTSHLNI